MMNHREHTVLRALPLFQVKSHRCVFCVSSTRLDKAVPVTAPALAARGPACSGVGSSGPSPHGLSGYSLSPEHSIQTPLRAPPPPSGSFLTFYFLLRRPLRLGVE